ncbi:MAG: AAA family ATPase [Candidatus Poribacteria bacterium]|nr:AAA family ATPase [Candidatus Poribacteria bacterium]
MSEQKAFLEKIYIKNFLSLQDVELSLKPLTVLVGANASGKSNVLHALSLLRTMMTADNLPPVEFVKDRLWAGGASHITFQLHAAVETTLTTYQLEFTADPNNPFVSEQLSINDVKVIAIQSGQGVVRDEDSENETKYTSNKLALQSAGAYGNKPITGALTEFVKEWKFYNFRPDVIRDSLAIFSSDIKDVSESPKLDSYGFRLPAVLSDWHENMPEGFRSVSESLADSMNIGIDCRTINGDNQLYLLEGYENPVPLKMASDGTLRLVAYYTLLNQPELPPLVAIEEPERNLHPGALANIAGVLEQLAERTQVIITTHSSQLLDAFSFDKLTNFLGVLFLHNQPGIGTEVINLEDQRGSDESLNGWLADFGIGSAIFHNEILQDMMEDQSACRE